MCPGQSESLPAAVTRFTETPDDVVKAIQQLRSYIEVSADDDPSKPARKTDYRTPDQIIAATLAAYDEAKYKPSVTRD